jgi:hypothetical protein
VIQDGQGPAEAIQGWRRDADETGVGSNPQIAVKVFGQSGDSALWSGARAAKIDRGEMSSVESIEPSVRADPQESVPCLNDGIHNIRVQPVFHSESGSEIAGCGLMGIDCVCRLRGYR